MKFTDGYWMLKEGTVHSNAIEIYDYQIKGKTLVLYAPFKSIQTKGDTLNMGMLSIELDSPIEDVIGVKAYHHIGGLPNQPQFQLNETEHEIIIDEKDDCLIYTSGKAQAVIKTIKGKYELSFYYDQFYTASNLLVLIKPRNSFILQEVVCSVKIIRRENAL